MKTKLLYFFFLISTTLFAQWQEVNISGFSNDAGGSNNRITVDNNNNLYIAYRHNSFKLDVIKFNGTSWSYVGNPELTSHQIKSNLDIKTDNNNVPYVVYTDNIANSQKLSVIKFNGSSWETVGSSFFSSETANAPKIDFDNNNVPYVVFDDFVESKNKLSVMKFNGTTWELVGARGFSDNAAYTTIVIDNNNVPYVAFNSTSNGNAGKTSVMKFNGTTWEFVGNEAFSTGYSRNHSLAISSNNTVYVAYHAAGTNDGSSNVLKFNGTNWEHLGAPGMGFYAKEQDLFIDKEGNLYLSYTETTQNEIRVHRFNGSSWTQLNTAIGIGNYSSVVKDANDDVYVVYTGSNSLDLKKISDKVLSRDSFSKLDAKLSVYPNPATSNITISLSDKTAIQKVAIYNILGDKVITKTIADEAKTNIDVSSLSAGIYFIRTKTAHQIVSKKLIIN